MPVGPCSLSALKTRRSTTLPNTSSPRPIGEQDTGRLVPPGSEEFRRRLGSIDVATVWDARMPEDRDDVARLWLAYLTWGNAELEKRYGFRLPVEEAVKR